ncbi:MAG TPA: T9SS type A sorting domain-containing protein [bacterium]|jgi:hypothetical protein
MRLFQLILLLSLGTAQVWAHATFTGYSGAPGRQTCATSCHGASGGTVTVSGFPTSYTPGQAYTITIGHNGGSTIANFNASCRIGTGSSNAGTIAAGTATAAYNVSGETNGIHFSSTNQNSGTFTWTAPAAGTGTVHLYVGAHQGSAGGANTTISVTATEVPGAPGTASAPAPANNAAGVAITTSLSWTAGSGATSHDVFFGTTNPPDSVTNQAGTSFDPAGDLTPGTVYYWQVNERNSIGVTAGPVWQFITLSIPGQASLPVPQTDAPDVAITTGVSWTAGSAAGSHDVYFGTTTPPAFIGNQATLSYDPAGDLTPGTVYYWRIDERNSSGVTPGDVWQFTTLAVPEAATEPSPADGDTAITVRVTLSWLAGARTDAHDVYLGTVNPPPQVMQGQSGGSYTPPQNLAEGTVYYWRVGEVNSSGTTLSPVWSFRTESPNAVGDPKALIPTELALGPVYPNPFNATVTIPFALPQASKVSVTLYDVTGRLVAVMTNGTYGAGVHSVQFSSEGVASGVYLVKLSANGHMLTTKVVALK